MIDLNNTCTTREAAQLLGVSLRTAQLWVESGVLEAWKTAGGHRRISRDSVQRVIEERTRHARQSPTRASVLVVEDDPSLLKLYSMTIASWDLPISLTTAENGYEGLVRIGEQRPDVLISDLRMPGIDGFRMVRSLARDKATANMNIIVISGLTPAEIAAEGGLPESVVVFSKPIPFVPLKKCLLDMLVNRRAAAGS